jgi:hypothetical protein
MGMIHVHSFGLEKPKRLIIPVGLETFKRWLTRTGIVHQTGQRRVYGPGEQATRISQMDWREMKELIFSGEDQF